MEIAAENNDTSLAKYCISKGGQVTERFMQRVALNGPYRLFEDLLTSTNNEPDHDFCHGGSGCTVATYAATVNDIDFVKLCLAHGARTCNADFEDYPAALAAIAEKASIEMAALWLEHGAELEGSGAIVAAAGAGKIDMVKYLLEKGANVNEATILHLWTSWGSNALHQATRNEREEMVALLIEKGGDVRLKDAKGKTPAIYALEMRNDNIMEMLFERINAIRKLRYRKECSV